MGNNKIMTITKEAKEKLAIELLYLRKKFLPKEFISYIYNRKDVYKELFNIIQKTHNKEEFYQLLESYLDVKDQKILPVGIETMKFTDTFIVSSGFIPKSIVKNILKNNYSLEEIKNIMETYELPLLNFINNNKKIKNKINNLEITSNESVAIADFTKQISLEEFRNICQYIGIPSEKLPYYNDKEKYRLYTKTYDNILVINTLIRMLLSLYDKNTILNNKEFIEFELEYGYTEKYYNILLNNGAIPSLEERLKTFSEERTITEREQYYLTQLDLLEERIATLTNSTKDLMLQKIALIREEKDLTKKAKLIKEVYEYYEREYRKQIVESLYSPSESCEVTDIDELKPLLLHLFIRDPYKMATTEEEKILEEVTQKRGLKVTSVQELTPEEKAEYDRRVKELREVLLNPVITNRSVNSPSFYSDANGWRWYKSDTSNQISTSLVGFEALMAMGNCIGVGFNSSSISPENIIISSNQYQTTNMGVDSLEISREDQFREKSAPLSELVTSQKTEVVMYRSKNNIDTKAAYVFAIISGTNLQRDEEMILKAREYAEKNNIKLVVFNQLKLRQSYEEKYGQKKEH